LPIPSEEFFQSIILPAGISFYTFQSMSYSIDLYFRKIHVERNFLAFLNYVAYLPQLIAGPIERYHHLHPQLEALALKRTIPQWKRGLDRLALGIIQKLFIADSCGFIVDTLLVDPHHLSFAMSWAIAIGFGMQIFYDFSAYSHMAIGISQLVGVKLWDNFLAPYQAHNVREFWHRWHITLSTWFRDYVYIPLGGSRISLTRTLVNLMITFTISGLWHGASWSFVLWGALHGTYLVVLVLLEKIFPAFRCPRPIGIMFTFVAVHYAWVLFRVSDLTVVTSLWKAMAGLHGLNRGLLSWPDILFLAVVVLFTLVSPHAAQRPPGKNGYGETLLLWLGAFAALGSSPELVQFIYFQF
ncbi:MAG: MBOAT family protein, partial [Bdellovibrionales bacterium]|nr:MBOAT family protein [Bdellovibrionales bacterium]